MVTVPQAAPRAGRLSNISRTPRPPMGADDRRPAGTHPRRLRSRLVSPMRELERDPTTDSAIAEAHGAVTPALPPLAIVEAGHVGSSLAGAARRAGLSATIAGREDALESCRDARSALPASRTARSPRPRRRSRRRSRRSSSSVTPAVRLAGRARPGPRRRRLRLLASSAADDPRRRRRLHRLSLRDRRFRCGRGAARPRVRGPPRHRGCSRSMTSIGPSTTRPPRSPRIPVALQESAAELLGATGAEDAREAFRQVRPAHGRQLVRARSRCAHRPDRAGDEETVERHLERCASGRPELVGLYEALADRTREIAARRDADGEQAR